ncbi:MAG: c-type cytochrome [Desulfosporosinus sp.]|nr:c-type cytochrome [Desulfosporosinus sp.]
MIISVGVTIGFIMLLSWLVLNPSTKQAGIPNPSSPGKVSVTSPTNSAPIIGQTDFIQNCSSCHQNVPSSKNLNKVIQIISQGKGRMPAFKGQLADSVISNIANYVISQN